MATRTRNYRLTKPEGTDLVDIEDLNGNFDIIDAQMKANADAARGKQDTLTFDESPTAGSRNPVRSGGIHTALQVLLVVIGRKVGLLHILARIDGQRA